MACRPEDILAWLGPAIGPASFEVGPEVRRVFAATACRARKRPSGRVGDRLLADIYRLARLELARAGVTAVFGGGLCTVGQPGLFHSYRRDGRTGRMASLIWIDDAGDSSCCIGGSRIIPLLSRSTRRFMSVLLWIVLASLLGGAISVCAAALVGYAASPRSIPLLISYSVGALLGASLLGVLPHAIHEIGSVELATSFCWPASSPSSCWKSWCCGGTATKSAARRTIRSNSHITSTSCIAVSAARPSRTQPRCRCSSARSGSSEAVRSASLILIGDAFHNFVDGVLIAAAFTQSVPLGIMTATAIVAHEIPQEVGDYLVLLHSGMSRMRALAFNLLSSMATLVGAVGAYFALSSMAGVVPYLLCIAAASMIYVAVADLIPGLHRRAELSATLQQVLLISAGIGSIVLIHHLVEGHGA
jgi:zinc and cadmium transporter